MKKVLLIVLPVGFVVLICVLGGGAYVGYRLVEKVLASGCVGCVQINNGGQTIRGSGTLKTETRTVGSFTSIDIACPGSVEIARTGTVGLSITADDNLLPLYTSDVRDGTLYLAIPKNQSLQGKSPVWKITIADLSAVRVSGANEVSATGLEGPALSVTVAGSAEIRLAGQADDLTLSLAGSGDLDAANLQTKQAKVVISGSGDATVNASDTLDVRIAGAGDVRYLGTPKLTKSVAGSGKVEQKQS